MITSHSINFIQAENIKDIDFTLTTTASPGDKWLAFHLEYDFVTQANSPQLAAEALERLVLGQVHLDIKQGLIPLQDIPKWSDYD